MISDAPHTTVPLLFDNMMKTYLPPLDQDGFDAVYSTEKIARIHNTFSTAVNILSGGNDDLVKERIISKAWHIVHKNETLCPGYLLNISEAKADETDTKKYRINGALIPESDWDLVDEDRPNYMLGDLGIWFERGGTGNDASDNRLNKNIEAGAYTLTGVRGAPMSYSERFFFFQHRTGLFMLLVNGGEFRVVRWDRSPGCLVTEILSYVDTPEHMKKLLQFLYAFSKATPAQRGVDPTATRLSEKSCGWEWMQKVAVAHPLDIDHAERTVVPSVPPGFIIKPTREAPPSSLFATNVLASDPAATTGFGDLSSSGATSTIIPVFKYVRDFFRKSISGTWLPYCLKVCGHDYLLVCEPIFVAPSHGVVGRGTRGYVALEWTTQRLVFLKDAWRPFYEGVDQEGATLWKLNDATVPFVPTLICHEDVGGYGAQETEASQYSSTGEKKRNNFGEQEKQDHPIALMPPSRSKASGSGSGGSTAQRSSGSNGRGSTSATEGSKASQGSGGRREKRPRSQDTPPVVLKDGFGLRHLTHYRIVVAEVCLPSTEIRSSEQLTQVIWYCMTAHKDAVVKCGLLHRDVSSGNILIRPTVACRETGEGIVIWFGVLSDWELAKALPGDQEVAKARQPHRTGTWYYMSVQSLKYPGYPLSIADELESFLHVMIYLAVRFLRTRSLNVGKFVDNYFEDFHVNHHGRTTCGYLKQNIIQTGSLMWEDAPVCFLAAPLPSAEGRDADSEQETRSEVLSPLNEIIANYLAFFKARYAVLEYERQAAKEEHAPLPSLLSTVDASSEAAAARAAWRDFRSLAGQQARGLSAPTKKKPSPTPAPKAARLEKPPQSVYDSAAQLSTHGAILDMLEGEVDERIWPADDYAGDRLVGCVPLQLQSTAKRARLHLRSTMQSIAEGEEAFARGQTAA